MRGAIRQTVIIMLVGMAGCESPGGDSGTGQVLTIATTTSLDATGLLEDLLPAFTAETGIRVNYVAVGTGHALRMGKRGDVDAILVHAPEDEARFLAAGNAMDRRIIARNEFLLLGPTEDPADCAGSPDAISFLRRLAENGGRFFSRADGSGTHRRELDLWKEAGIDPSSLPEYWETGTGMDLTLVAADEKRGYTLCDEGTYLTLRRRVDLAPLARDPGRLTNTYSILRIHPARHPSVRVEDAGRLADWLRGPIGQRRIADFRRNGAAMFEPAASGGD